MRLFILVIVILLNVSNSSNNHLYCENKTEYHFEYLGSWEFDELIKSIKERDYYQLINSSYNNNKITIKEKIKHYMDSYNLETVNALVKYKEGKVKIVGCNFVFKLNSDSLLLIYFSFGNENYIKVNDDNLINNQII